MALELRPVQVRVTSLGMACKTYQYVLKASTRHARMFTRWSGCRRWVWNHALKTVLEPISQKRAEEKADPANEGKALTKYPSAFDLMKMLTGWKKQYSWLAQAPSHALQQAIADLMDALSRVAAGGGFPKAKRRGKSIDSFRETDPLSFSIDQANSRIKIPKIRWVRYFNSRSFEGKAKTLTILKRGDRWFASIQVELPDPATPPVHPHATVQVGIDRGIAKFGALSDGSVIPSISPLKAHLKELRVLQRSVSRKTRGGKNWKKAVKRVAALQSRIARIRKDYLHKVTTHLAKNHGVVVLEDLKIANMTASAEGTVEEPGRNVKAKSGLNRAILDQGWGYFEQMLEYKLKERGGLLLKVPAPYTSQRCSSCGHTSPENRKIQASFVCLGCGYIEDADTNAARNILRAGQALLGAPMKIGNQPHQGRAQKPSRRSTRKKVISSVSQAGNP